MAQKIIWTQQAELTFNHVIAYLQENWSSKEIEKFIVATEEAILLIGRFPKLFRRSSKAGIHEVLITPHNLLVYKITHEAIYLITFWDTRQNPKKKPVK